MSRNILFLDMDGVLNNRRSMSEPGDSLYRVDYECTQRLLNLWRKVPFQIVLSSTWRLYASWDQVNDAMFRCGWFRPPFIDKTRDLRVWGESSGEHTTRGRECLDWIRRCGRPGDKYVAVDDDNDFGPFVKSGHTLVLTQHEPGLTQENVHQIRAAFERVGGQP